MSDITTPFDLLRRPEYTGENRCMPCTIVNSVLAIVLAAGFGMWWLPAGAVLLVVFAGTIYFRGYLIPKTPELTRNYFPEWLLYALGKEPRDLADVGGRIDGVYVEAKKPNSESRDQFEPNHIEQLLLSSGVAQRCPNKDDLCLNDEFRADWWRRISRVRENETHALERFGTIMNVDPSELTFDTVDGKFTTYYGGEPAAQWESDAAFYADLAVEPTIAERLTEWENFHPQVRTELIAGMRAFLKRCPACEADLETVETVRETCCGDEVVGANVRCEDCGARIFGGVY